MLIPRLQAVLFIFSERGKCLQVQGLESLARMLCMDVIELRRERDRALASRTLSGHAKNFLGYCLSFYCLFRYATSAPAQ